MVKTRPMQLLSPSANSAYRSMQSTSLFLFFSFESRQSN